MEEIRNGAVELLPLGTLRDGGTGIQAHTDFKSAYASVGADDRRRGFIALGAAGVTLAVLLLSRLFWLFKPLLDRISYGTVSAIIYYAFLALLFTGYAIGLHFFLEKHAGLNVFRVKKQQVSIPRALGAVAVCAAAMFVAGASLGFKYKMEAEIGKATATNALITVAAYIYYAEHIFMGFVLAELVQTALSTLLPARFTVPWGAIALVTVFGLVEFALEIFATNHALPWIYYLFTFAYAAVYMLTHRSFHISLWASIILMIL